jgi:sugar/nucleoside kinase (ribokinase family)
MGETFVPFYNHLLAWLREHPEVKVAFNPGSWQIRIEPAMLKLILARTEVIYVNRKEAEIITGFGPSQNKDKELLVALSKTGPKMVIITDGERGSYIYDGQKFLRCGVLPVDAYERTGAGDSFGSGCIAALVKEKPLDEALLWGTVNSASVIGYVGAQKGLLHEEDMRVWLDRAKSSDVVVSEF